MTSSLATSVKFSELCNVFEKICASKKNEKSAALSEFINKLKIQFKRLLPTSHDIDKSFFSIMRLILPKLERERNSFGLKEYTLARKIIKMLSLPSNGTDSKLLLNFRTSVRKDVENFSDAAYFVLKKHFLRGDKLSIEDINIYLNKIAESNSNNDPRTLEDQLHELFQNTSADEQKWLIRIILKDLRLGIGESLILKLYHPDAADLYATNNNLSKVCCTLSDNSVRLHEIQISLFEPFQPMLSQKCDAKEFHKALDGRRCFYIENKFDGERFQLHMKGKSFKYYSRNGFDYTNTYGSDFNSGLYTPLLRNAFKGETHKIILDGEMMGWNKSTKTFGSKGMEYDVKKLNPDSKHQPCFCVFDILLYNEQVLTNKPLKERLVFLKKVVSNIEGVIQVSKYTEISDKQQVLDALNNTVEKKEEGIVFKDVDSIYKSNDRKAGWWKMKLEFFEDVMNDLDVVIMGGYYGEGRNRHKIHGFLVGVVDKSSPKLIYLSLAKVTSGLNNQELSIIYEKLGPFWQTITASNQQEAKNYGLEWGNEKPDVWIIPEKSCVLTIRATELIKIHSNDFKTKYTLRFPRIQSIRLDKPVIDCLDVYELENLTTSKNVEKLSKRFLELDDIKLPEKKRVKKNDFMYVEEQEVEKKNDLLLGHEFFVLSGYETWKKTEVEIAIRENGGRIVKTEGVETLCILVGDYHPRVNSCKNSDVQYDLVNLKWLQKVLSKGVFEMYCPNDMLHTSKKTINYFLKTHDKYGDSFTKATNLNTLKYTLENIKISGDYINPFALEIENLKWKHPLNIFENCLAYFETSEDYLIEKMLFTFFGGSITEILNDEVTHIFTNNRSNNLLSTTIHTGAAVIDVKFIHQQYNEALIRLC